MVQINQGPALGKFCKACQAIPSVGFCKLTGCPAMPNPGSDMARDHGCTCPVLDNGHGRGPGPFWINGDCPLHGSPSPNPQDEQ